MDAQQAIYRRKSKHLHRHEPENTYSSRETNPIKNEETFADYPTNKVFSLIILRVVAIL